MKLFKGRKLFKDSSGRNSVTVTFCWISLFIFISVLILTLLGFNSPAWLKVIDVTGSLLKWTVGYWAMREIKNAVKDTFDKKIEKQIKRESGDNR